MTCDVQGGVRCLLVIIILTPLGCVDAPARARLARENQALREERNALERTVADHEQTITALNNQVATLQEFEPDRPVGVFAPVKLEFARLSGGADFDDQPGDDGVAAYLRLKDADGDNVKAAGRITVQILDLTEPAKPRVLGVCTIDDVEALRKSWFGRFGTQHYTIRCPFEKGAALAGLTKVTIQAEFVDYQTGRTLNALQEVDLHVPLSEGAARPSD